MQKAVDVLTQISHDLSLAREREVARRLYLAEIAEASAEGEVRGRVAGLLDLLAARDITLTSEQRRRIEATGDAKTLRAWVAAAARGATVDEMFDATA